MGYYPKTPSIPSRFPFVPSIPLKLDLSTVSTVQIRLFVAIFVDGFVGFIN
jgi:hypothetical protein